MADITIVNGVYKPTYNWVEYFLNMHLLSIFTAEDLKNHHYGTWVLLGYKSTGFFHQRLLVSIFFYHKNGKGFNLLHQ